MNLFPSTIAIIGFPLTTSGNSDVDDKGYDIETICTSMALNWSSI